MLVPIGLIATGVAYLSLAPRPENYAHRAKFESAGWSSESRDQTSLWPTRLRMVDDLVASWIRIDSEWLVLRFDEAGRVAEYRIARD